MISFAENNLKADRGTFFDPPAINDHIDFGCPLFSLDFNAISRHSNKIFINGLIIG